MELYQTTTTEVANTTTARRFTEANTAQGSTTIHDVWPSSDFVEHLHEVSVRLESAAGIAARALLGEIDRDRALEALLGMLTNCRHHLRAVGS
jgi:hypothetical protein